MSLVDYERVLCVKYDIQVYTRIPPRASNRGYMAKDWKLDSPDYVGRLRVVAKDKLCVIKIEDKTTGELFAEAPVDVYPGISVENVLDSSRYFVIRITDGVGRKAFIGIGFTDRGDSFDFNVALQEHFKWLKQMKEIAEQEKKEEQNPGPKLDLGFKEGQTIKINIGGKKGTSRPRSTGGGMANPLLIPPPPGSTSAAKPCTIPPPGSAAKTPLSSQQQQPVAQPPSQQQIFFEGVSQHGTPNSNLNLLAGNNNQQSNVDLLGAFTGPAMVTQPTQPITPPPSQGSTDWGDFTGASSGAKTTDWVTF